MHADIVYQAMRENRQYCAEELCAITGLAYPAMAKTLISLLAGGMILNLTNGAKPAKRLYMTRQTMLNLEWYGPDKSQLELIRSEQEKTKSTH